MMKNLKISFYNNFDLLIVRVFHRVEKKERARLKNVKFQGRGSGVSVQRCFVTWDFHLVSAEHNIVISREVVPQ